MAMQQADTALDVIRRVESWAESRGVALPPGFALDLGEAYHSAGVLTDSVDRLLSKPGSAEDEAKLLSRLEAWVYSDLVDHLTRLREPLNDVINRLLEKAQPAPE